MDTNDLVLTEFAKRSWPVTAARFWVGEVMNRAPLEVFLQRQSCPLPGLSKPRGSYRPLPILQWTCLLTAPNEEVISAEVSLIALNEYVGHRKRWEVREAGNWWEVYDTLSREITNWNALEKTATDEVRILNAGRDPWDEGNGG